MSEALTYPITEQDRQAPVLELVKGPFLTVRYRALPNDKRLLCAGNVISTHADLTFIDMGFSDVPPAESLKSVVRQDGQRAIHGNTAYYSALWTHQYDQARIDRYPILKVWANSGPRKSRILGWVELLHRHYPTVGATAGHYKFEPTFWLGPGKPVSAVSEQAMLMQAIIDEAVCGFLPEE